jgi:hypothetical protein
MEKHFVFNLAAKSIYLFRSQKHQVREETIVKGDKCPTSCRNHIVRVFDDRNLTL